MTDRGIWFEGGCHCEGVRFRVRLKAPFKALRCNCSICSMKGFINIIAAQDDFELLRGEHLLATYRFNTHVAQHRFCTACGIHPFSRPRSHPEGFDVNGRCLDRGFDFLRITNFDGRHWEDNISKIQSH